MSLLESIQKAVFDPLWPGTALTRSGFKRGKNSLLYPGLGLLNREGGKK